jgi:phosphomannomutase
VACDLLNVRAALVVTASHNPQEWNGLKCLIRSTGDDGEIDACAPDAKTAADIIARFRAGEQGVASEGDVLEEPNAVADHVGCVVGRLGAVGLVVRSRLPWKKTQLPGEGRRVVLDSVNSSGAGAGACLLEALGCNGFIPLNADPTGLFPHPPEPVRENLTALSSAVKERSADIGFAQDPDADRLAIVDERGEYIGEEYTLALAAEALLSANPKSQIRNLKSERVLVANLSTSRMIDDIAAKYGARVVRTAVGEANVVEAMKREKAAGHDVVLGGEGNGGVIWPQVTYVRDSLSAMALVLALMARTGKKVSELVAAIPAYAIEKRKVDLARKEDATPAVEKIAAAYREQKVDRQDGVRVDWADRRAWLHVRASNTEPIMRLIAEAPTAAEARAILDEAARIIAG